MIDDDVEGMTWGSDVPISMPVPPSDQILVDMGAFGFTNFGMAHNLNSADIERFMPTYLPSSGSNGD